MQDFCSLKSPSYRNVLEIEIESVGSMDLIATVQEAKIEVRGSKNGFITGCKFSRGKNN